MNPVLSHFGEDGPNHQQLIGTVSGPIPPHKPINKTHKQRPSIHSFAKIPFPARQPLAKQAVSK